MLDDLIRLPFEFFVTVVWDRYGPIAGIITAVTVLSLLIAILVLVLKYVPKAVGFS